ncbi:hypothetical protein H4R33_006048 [Dimargaris cristalligena]|nr:hypothetical protein H4R33_006048 [Dimargaris cristalligena]
MDPEDFAIMFPMVARALKAGTGEIPELDTLIVRVNSIDYGPGHDSLSSGLPDLGSTNLPNDLTRQTLRRIPYLVQSHLAAHFVVHKNLGGFKQIIRSWIASDRNDPTPSSSTPVFEDSKLELTNMPLTGGVLDVGLGSLDSILAIRSQGFDPQNNDPLDTSGDYPLYNGRSRLPIATLFMWALEYEIIEAEELFTEFGNPFLKRDLPCFLALGFQVTYSSVGLDYNDEPLLSPKEQFGCYQQFTFQGYIAMPPNDHEPESVEIWVRHNRKLNPEEGLEPGDDGETTATLEKKLGELLELVDDSEDLQDLDEIDTRIYPILTWARSFGTAIHYLKNSTLAESTGINQETTYRNESPIPIAPEDLIRGVNKIIELLKFLMSKIEMRESYLTSIDGKMDTVMADVAEEDSISYSSESEQDDDLVDTIHTMADDILVELTNGLQILSEKYLFRAAILEGLKGYQTPVNI